MNSLLLFLVILFTGLYFDRFDVFKICILSSVLHEMGHIAAYRLIIKKWPQINISVFGFRMNNIVSYNKYFIIIVLRGPFINLLITAITGFLMENYVTFSILIWHLVNRIILSINILPVRYLDGGQVLYCLSPFYQRNYKFFNVAAIALMSVMVFSFTGVNISLLLFLIYFIVNIINDI